MKRVSAPMRRWVVGAALATVAGLGASTAWAGPDVGVSVQISQPGVYGRVDIGNYPQPQVIVAQPVIVAAPRVRPAPVYMWVPPGHRKHWSKHCGHYNACGVPVYFVQDNWYHEHVDRREQRDDEDHDHHHDERGHGNGHGKGHGHGRGH